MGGKTLVLGKGCGALGQGIETGAAEDKAHRVVFQEVKGFWTANCRCSGV
jgi:hypothetical protein